MEIAFFRQACSFEAIGFEQGRGRFINLSARPITVVSFDETRFFPDVTVSSSSTDVHCREFLFSDFVDREGDLPSIGIKLVLLAGAGGYVGACLTDEKKTLYDDGGFDRSQPQYSSAEDLLQEVIFSRKNTFMFPALV